MARKTGAKNKDTGRRFKAYEGRRPDDKHLRLTKDMVLDPIFVGLSSSAKVLYMYMKLWAVGQDTVKYATSMAKDYFGSNNTFKKARNELIEKGFINYINEHRSKDMCETAEYEFSNRWQILSPPKPIKPHVKKPPLEWDWNNPDYSSDGKQ